jgi:hypothetical protein
MELIKQISSFYQALHQSVSNLKSLRLARRLVYAWVFVNYGILSTKADFFYAADSMIPLKNFSVLTSIEKIFNLLHSPDLVNLYPVFLGLVLISSALAIFEIFPRVTAAATFFLMMNLDNKAHVILDGGNNLIHLLALYLILVNPKKTLAEVSNTVTNLAVLMIKLQVVFVYATAGLLKVMGPLWNKGVALYYTMGVSEYGNPWIFRMFSEHAWMLAAFTLGTVLFQLSLPYLIWMKKWRPLVILAGTGLHLSISLVMGLFMFGLAMCVSYFFFHEDKETAAVPVSAGIL